MDKSDDNVASLPVADDSLPSAAGASLQAADGQAERDRHFMGLALAQARQAGAIGEVPIGAVVAIGDRLVASAHNRREVDADPAAHAEFSAICAAAAQLGRWRLSDCTVYVTLEPCLMCAGLMLQARIARCVYGAPDPKAGALGTLYCVNADSRLNHRFAVESGVLAAESAELLRGFFVALRGRGAAGRGETGQGAAERGGGDG